jgi:PIN domain nuclease of toxin-antitoxin system
MRLLLDTHVTIWLSYEPNRVPDRVGEAIAHADEVFASVISGWEYEQKRNKHGVALPRPFPELVRALLLSPLAFAFDCHAYAASLPPIHADPFDRMLIAQALHHDLTLVTIDLVIRDYPVETLW